MKILHVCLGAFYIDNFSYQENMLPKYHKKMGHDVKIVASTLSFDDNGVATNVAPREYLNEYGIEVARLPYKKYIGKSLGKFFRVYEGLYSKLESFSPDIIFIHGCQFLDIKIIAKYAKERNPIIYVDNHADFSNSARNWLSLNVQHKLMWRRCAQIILPYTKKFYGVLPARVDFLNDVYKIPSEKIDLLVMGLDTDVALNINKKTIRKEIRRKYEIEDSTFLIITGGKIDHSKKQIFNLIRAVMKSQKDIKLIIFGSVIEEYKTRLIDLCDDSRIIYVGWLGKKEIYQHLVASDLAVYPGRHSVLWEETVGLNIPMVVKYWPGTNHIDIGGNVLFLKEDSVECIEKNLDEIIDNKYAKMQNVANSEGAKNFSYEQISRNAIEE